MTAFKYKLVEPVKVTGDFREVVPMNDPRGVYRIDAGSLVDIEDAERWGITTAEAEIAKADSPRKTCAKCGLTQ